jgi:hypothetical protein
MPKTRSMKRILDPTFRYRQSFDTDIRKTFAAVRRRARETDERPTPAQEKVTVLRVIPRALPDKSSGR